jgi:hypothetical protein
MQITATQHKGISWVIKFKFSKWEEKKFKSFKTTMKDMIPESDRQYNPMTYEWTILERYWEQPITVGDITIYGLKDIITAQGWSVTEERVEDYSDFFYNTVAEPHLETKQELHDMLVSMLGANFDKKAYRVKALEWHPDRNGGDGQRMAELNRVWSAYNNATN